MLFPDVSDQLLADVRGAYVTLLVLAAAVDGRLKSEELAVLESVMGRMLMHPDVRAKQRMLLESPPDIKEVLGATTDRVRRLALRDTLLVCAIDGEYSYGIDGREVRRGLLKEGSFPVGAVASRSCSTSA